MHVLTKYDFNRVKNLNSNSTFSLTSKLHEIYFYFVHILIIFLEFNYFRADRNVGQNYENKLSTLRIIITVNSYISYAFKFKYTTVCLN